VSISPGDVLGVEVGVERGVILATSVSIVANLCSNRALSACSLLNWSSSCGAVINPCCLSNISALNCWFSNRCASLKSSAALLTSPSICCAKTPCGCISC
jgi:hypothetical protein